VLTSLGSIIFAGQEGAVFEKQQLINSPLGKFRSFGTLHAQFESSSYHISVRGNVQPSTNFNNMLMKNSGKIQ